MALHIQPHLGMRLKKSHTTHPSMGFNDLFIVFVYYTFNPLFLFESFQAMTVCSFVTSDIR